MIRHICLTCGLGLILCATAYPDDPQPKTEPKPQWQRMLTGDDAKKAAELAKRVAKSELADKYEEAIRLQKELLELWELPESLYSRRALRFLEPPPS